MLKRRTGWRVRRLGRAAGDDRGVAAVEFAVIASLMVMMLLGTVDVVPALIAKFKVSHSTQTATNVAAAFSKLQTADMTSVMASTTDVMSPLPTATLGLRLTNVYSDGAGHAYVYWSCGQGGLSPLAARAQVTTTPTGMAVSSILQPNNNGGANGTNSSYLMGESQYVYTATVQFVIKAPVTMTSVSYVLPRLSSYVGFPWDGTTNQPTVPTAATRTASVTLANGAVCNYAY